MVNNLGEPPLAASTEWERFHNSSSCTLPPLTAIQPGVAFSICEGVRANVIGGRYRCPFALALVTEANVIGYGSKATGTTTDTHSKHPHSRTESP